MQSYTYTRSSTFHLPFQRNENETENPTRPFKFRKEEPLPQRVFGTEISNISKPLRPLKRAKNSSVSEETQLINPRSGNVVQNPLINNNTTNESGKTIFSLQYDKTNTMMEEESNELAFEKQSPQLVGLYVHEIFNYLRESESKFQLKIDYMTRHQKDINEKMRGILIDWIVDVHLKFKLRAETLFLTVNIIDRYLEKIPILRSKLQLVGVASMLIACKYEEIYAPEIKDFVYITDKAYSKEEILQMEGNILSALEFNLTFCSSLQFLERYGTLAQLEEKMMMLAKYILELTLVEYKMTKYSQSLIACSAIYLVNKMRKVEGWTESMVQICRFTENELKQCAKEMFAVLQNVEKTNLQAIRRKFALPRFMEVSKLVQESR